MVTKLFGTVTGKRLAVLDFAFKADINDTRLSPVISICRDLLEKQTQFLIVDPKVAEAHIVKDLSQAPFGKDPSGKDFDECGGWHMASSALEAAIGADAVLLITEWMEFADLDWEAIGAVMRKPAWLFDVRATADAAARAPARKVGRVEEG